MDPDRPRRQRQADTTGIAVLTDTPTLAGAVTAALLCGDDGAIDALAAGVNGGHHPSSSRKR